ncbi:hypothetical protein [Streptomyces flavofungini]|uniref:Uncharacterized protein n=1 Tax=Streptomyces flavofungini TaxID=68200 RepID=A0ABS0WZN5_9ACTN|nr:hypothetical protein [Streptomyces flavofungini]MBJ3806314.1 hypothetical protein [Streptomyces flavofungini]GHC45950.1 hypothetical protein GCM10010349_08480 [Streptomyces flavofungini]
MVSAPVPVDGVLVRPVGAEALSFGGGGVPRGGRTRWIIQSRAGILAISRVVPATPHRDL